MDSKLVRQLGDPVLKEKCAPVRSFGKELQADVLELIKVFHELYKPVGLAAPQIGITKRIFLARLNADKEHCGVGLPRVFINPKIIEHGGKKVRDIEECISIGRRPCVVERFYIVVVKAQSENGDSFVERLIGWPARIIQHELDHLNGLLVTDRSDEAFLPTITSPRMRAR